MKQGRIRFLQRECTLESTSDLFTSLSLFLAPFFDVTEGKSAKSGLVFRLEHDPRPLGELLKRGYESVHLRCIPLHLGMTGWLISREVGNTLVLAPEINTAYVIARDDRQVTITLVCADLSDATMLDLLRLVRGCLIALSLNDGMSQAHMSVVTLRGRAFAFIGGTGAGKTSFMLAFLQQIEGSSFITNDKALVTPASQGPGIAAFGLPYAISIGFGALNRCVQIVVDPKTRVIDDEAYFWPPELVGYFDRTISTRADLSATVAVQIDPSVPGLNSAEVAFVHEKEDLIRANVFEFSDAITPYWLLDLIGIGKSPARDLTEALAHKPMYKLHGNPWDGNLKGFFERYNWA